MILGPVPPGKRYLRHLRTMRQRVNASRCTPKATTRDRVPRIIPLKTPIECKASAILYEDSLSLSDALLDTLLAVFRRARYLAATGILRQRRCIVLWHRGLIRHTSCSSADKDRLFLNYSQPYLT